MVVAYSGNAQESGNYPAVAVAAAVAAVAVAVAVVVVVGFGLRMREGILMVVPILY